MLLWEALTINGSAAGGKADLIRTTPVTTRRLPFERRCAKITKSGKRCRGRIRPTGEYCPLHDPRVVARRQVAAAKPHRRKNPLTRLPDGYLRKLSTYAAAGNALDRLYREVRLEIITPQMGRVLFDILARLMDTGLLENTRNVPRHRGRTRAARLRPRMAELLTRAEKRAWQKAVGNAPPGIVRRHGQTPDVAETADTSRTTDEQSVHRLERPRNLSLQAAS